jgi:hypothetical protein
LRGLLQSGEPAPIWIDPPRQVEPCCPSKPSDRLSPLKPALIASMVHGVDWHVDERGAGVPMRVIDKRHGFDCFSLKASK